MVTVAIPPTVMLSPLGWAQLAYPFGAQRWWALLPAVLVPAALGHVLSASRPVHPRWDQAPKDAPEAIRLKGFELDVAATKMQDRDR